MTPPFIDPTTIDPTNNPRVIFTSQPEIVSDAIELREDGTWGGTDDCSHMMTLTKPGFFNCEDPSGFSQILVTAYMTPGTKIYVFSFIGMTPQAYQAWCMIVASRLGKVPYDFLQIMGQAIGLDFLHMPGTEDCSEEGVREMKGISPYMPKPYQSLVNGLSNQSNPQQVINACLGNPLVVNFDGVWNGTV